MSQKNNAKSPSLHPGWTPVPDERMPGPTFWPASLALGTVLVLWGLVTSFIVATVGFILLIVSIAGWLKEMRHD